MNVDYHIHTTCSDGTKTPKEIMELAARMQLHSISITDHDSIEGIREAKLYCPTGLHYITGLEITCRQQLFPSFTEPLSLHLLGYCFDEKDTQLNLLLKKRSEKVTLAFASLIAQLNDMWNLSLSLKDIPISLGCVLQLCDIRNYVNRKYPALSAEASTFIENYAPALSAANLSLAEGISAIHHAGGVAVWAHPYHVYHNFRKKTLSTGELNLLLDTVKAMGIDGIEANYYSFDATQTSCLNELASSHHLSVTFGSDYHGFCGRDHIGMSAPCDCNIFTNI